MLGLMKLSREIYNYFVQDYGALGVGDILIPFEGVFVNIENVPSSYIEETYGYTKEAFIAMLAVEVETSYFEDNCNV